MILKNKRHEIYALAIFKGMTQRAAALEAGYKPSRVDVTASELVRNSKVAARIQELHQAAASVGIMSVRERQERLSTFGREDIRSVSGTVIRQGSISAIAELSKLGGDYPPAKVEVEAGKELGEALSKLLSGLRGYKESDAAK